MRTSKTLCPTERTIYQPELPACPVCSGPLALYNYLAWDKTVQTLDSVLSIAIRPGHCADPTCPGHTMRLLSAQGQQIAMPGSTYGYDVLVRIGWLRQERRETYPEIQAELSPQVQISKTHVRYLYHQFYLPLLACHARRHWARLEQAAQQHRGLIIALDGLAPEGGEPQLWFIRELLTGLALRSGWLSQQDHTTFEAFLEPVAQLPWPILAVLSDKQKGLLPAVDKVLPHSQHQFCQGHYLQNLAEPLAEADEAFKVELRKTIRQEVGDLIRAEKPADAPEGSVLTVTGLLPSPLAVEAPPTASPEPVSTVNLETAQVSSTADPEPVSTVNPETAEAQEIVDSLTRRIRYLLTLKGRPPFGLAGIEAYATDCADVEQYEDWVACHDINPQWAVRNSTAVYLRRVAESGVFTEEVNRHILDAAGAYRAAYAEWGELYELLGHGATEAQRKNKERREAGAAAVRRGLEYEKAGVEQLRAALSMIEE